jgi:hypothetical protein
MNETLKGGKQKGGNTHGRSRAHTACYGRLRLGLEGRTLLQDLQLSLLAV